MVTFPTRKSNTLDIFATNRPGLVNKCIPIPGIGDHEAIYVESTILATYTPPVRRKLILWHKADHRCLSELITSYSNNFLSRHTIDAPIEVLWNEFKQLCLDCINSIPHKMSSSRFNQPWVTAYTKRLCRKKKRLYNKAHSSGLSTDWINYHRMKRQVQYECRNAYEQYIANLINSESQCTNKRFWSFIKNQRCDPSGVPSLTKDGSIISDDYMKANELNNYFTSVFTKEDTSQIPIMNCNSYPDSPPIIVTCDGVTRLLSNLHPNKAAGPDKLPSRFLKQFAIDLAPMLTLIYQASLNQGSVPEDWKKALVTPVFKKGDRSLAANYRPISLTCIICKQLEHIISTNIHEHLEKHGILHSVQHGFRKQRSCETQLINTVHDFASALNNREQIDAILLDMSKAFDTVPHERLCYKLSLYGIRGVTLKWIRSFLSGRTQKVILNGQESNTTRVLSGVPQGSVLGPLLFIVYINDMPNDIASNIKLYADDALLYRTIYSITDTHILQNDLNMLQQWATTWLMTFNPSKCEFLQLTNKNRPLESHYHINNKPIKQVTTAKYLGVTIDKNLSWSEHTRIVVNKANSALGFLRRNIGKCSTEVKSLCYKSLVRPILDYASVIWSPYHQHNIHSIEMVQRRAARFVYSNYDRYASVTQMLTNIGWLTMSQRREKLRAIMLFKIINNLVKVSATDELLNPQTNATRGHTRRFKQLNTNIDSYLHSFFPATIKLWNKLPEDLINHTDLQRFKEGIFNLHC